MSCSTSAFMLNTNEQKIKYIVSVKEDNIIQLKLTVDWQIDFQHGCAVIIEDNAIIKSFSNGNWCGRCVYSMEVN